MSADPPQAPTLLGRAREVARLRHLSMSTEDSYLLTSRRFIRFHQGRHPREMGVDEIRSFLSHLAIDRNVAASTQNAALAGLLFLYRDVLQLQLPNIDAVERARRPIHRPAVLTRSQVREVLDRMEGIETRRSYVSTPSGDRWLTQPRRPAWLRDGQGTPATGARSPAR